MSNPIIAGLTGVFESEDFQMYVFMPMLLLIGLAVMAGTMFGYFWVCQFWLPHWLGWPLIGIGTVIFLFLPYGGTFLKHYKEAQNGS